MSNINKIKVGETVYDVEDSTTAAAVAAEANARQIADGNLQTAIAGKQDALNAAQTAAVNSGIDSTKVAQIATNAARIDAVDGKIPTQASASNQLADKAFVNSTVQTSSANFRGNWANWAAVPTNADGYPVDADGNKTPTKNDYLVVQDASDYTATTLTGTWRFKYSGEWATDGKAGWHPEYQVNETPLTAAQLAALNSGATAALMAKLAGIPADAEANTIDSISVNGTAVTPDADKNVDLTIPEGIKTLTTSDYNYPTNNPTSLNPMVLAPGIYEAGEQLVFMPDVVSGAMTLRQGEIFVRLNDASSNPIVLYGRASSLQYHVGDNSFGRNYVIEPVNNLTTSNNNRSLSATQGKVLKDLIDTLNTAFTGTDGTTAGTQGLVPAPATTDADKFLKADGTWGEAGGDESPFYLVTFTGAYSSSNYSDRTVDEIKAAFDAGKIPLFYFKDDTWGRFYAVSGNMSGANWKFFQSLIVVGKVIGTTGLPAFAHVTVNYNSTQNKYVYNSLPTNDIVDDLTSTETRRPLSANQGRILNGKIVGTTETATIATTDWAALTDSDPYDYSATITATATINANTGVVELLNDQPALFGTYGFAIGAVSGQSVTIYSIGQPDASVSLKLNIRNL